MNEKATLIPFVVYGLFTVTADHAKRYFYVGQTERAVEDRVREHFGRTHRGHEDLYDHLRRLEAANQTWDFEVLERCEGNEYRQDAERIEVIRLLCEGHELRNMRYGNAAHRAELARQVDDITIRTAADVRAARLFAELCRQRRKRSRLRTRELKRALKEEGLPSVSGCALLADVTRRRLWLACDGADMSLHKGFTLRALIHDARNYRKSVGILENLRRETPHLPRGPVRMVRSIRATVAGLAD